MFGRDDDVRTEIYKVRERLFDLGDDYWIETADGDRVFKVDGKVLRIRDTFAIEDVEGTRLAKMQQRPVRVRETYKIERDGWPDATLRKALVSPFRDKWKLEADDVGEVTIRGDLLDHEYEFTDDDGRTIAVTSKRWFRVRDTYGVEIDEDVDPVLILAAAVAIDQMIHEDEDG